MFYAICIQSNIVIKLEIRKIYIFFKVFITFVWQKVHTVHILSYKVTSESICAHKISHEHLTIFQIDLFWISEGRNPNAVTTCAVNTNYRHRA